ncbi:hypothetical protein JAAARDRAFT_28419 [Jaapia argillacea MUCL 33604]|uniref:Uncharacterized protein n=1 Tax=Jaapia argillacea MUCL 33604 TaxID=933084 RepID=A0A067QCS0_9AGAM|nr:hypothetical protein JAAARDRAFT_28419 [Jaapia argillacea MUCL 33604]
MGAKQPIERTACKPRVGPLDPQIVARLMKLRPLKELPPELIPSGSNRPPIMWQGYPANQTIILPFATEHNLVDRDQQGEILWLTTWEKSWGKLDGEFTRRAELAQVWEVRGGVLWVV